MTFCSSLSAVAEEEDECEGDEDAPAELVVDAQLPVQHEVQVVQERRKAWKEESASRIPVVVSLNGYWLKRLSRIVG